MFDVVLLEKPIDEGLTRAEIIDMLDVMVGDDYTVIEIENPEWSSVAVGFITMTAYQEICDSDRFYNFIGNILCDMANENDLGVYEFQNTPEANPLKVYLSRNID